MRRMLLRGLAVAGFAVSWAFLATIAVFAADLKGGGCCADLEERVAELEATYAKKGNRKMTVTIYGQVHKGMLWLDAKGLDTKKGTMLDPGHDPSRVGFMGEAKIAPDWKAGYVLELQIANPGAKGFDTGKALLAIPGSADGKNELQFGEQGMAIRHSYLWIEGTPGKVSLGHTSMATDGITEISTANTGVAVRPLSLSPVQFGGAASGLNMPFDGYRANVVRYDSKTMAGFLVSASMTEDESWDAAIRYAAEFSGFRFAAGLGYRDQKAQTLANVVNLLDLITVDVTGSHKAVSGSASLKHLASGLFATAFYSRLTHDLTESVTLLGLFTFSGTPYSQRQTGYGGQVGIEKNWTGLGNTTLYGEWQAVKGSFADPFPVGLSSVAVLAQGGFSVVDLSGTPTIVGLGVVQSFDAAAMDIYANWRQYDADVEGVSKVNTLGIGARIKF